MATGVFIVTSAQLSRNGTMKHEAMPDHASSDVKLPKSIYSDYVISVSATSYDLVYMNSLHYLIDMKYLLFNSFCQRSVRDGLSI